MTLTAVCIVVELDLMLCHVQLGMVKKASTPEPASMAAEKPVVKKPAAGGSAARPANTKRIAARVVKAKEDTSPEHVTPEHVPDQKVKSPGMHIWGSMALGPTRDRRASFKGHLHLEQTLDYTATSSLATPLPFSKC